MKKRTLVKRLLLLKQKYFPPVDSNRLSLCPLSPLW